MLFLAVSANSCEKGKKLTLPPETQTGANTFGALVNGEPFVCVPLFSPQAGKKIPAISATYYRSSGWLYLQGETNLGGGDYRYIIMNINNPCEDVFTHISFAYFQPKISKCGFFACENCDQIFITKFDTINHIVSGRFKFSGRCARSVSFVTQTAQYTGDSTVHITEGRFDIKLNIYE